MSIRRWIVTAALGLGVVSGLTAPYVFDILPGGEVGEIGFEGLEGDQGVKGLNSVVAGQAGSAGRKGPVGDVGPRGADYVAPPPTHTYSPPTSNYVPSDPYLSDEEMYLGYMCYAQSSFCGVSESILIENAVSMCEYLGAGGTIDGAFGIGAEVGLTTEEEATLVVGSVAYYCPQYQYLVDSY